MRIHSLQTLDDDSGGSDGSIVLKQKFSHSHRRVRALAMASAGGMMAIPFLLLLSTPEARTHLVELAATEPLSALQLGTAAAIALSAVYFGIAELSRPSVRQRTICLDHHRAIVEDIIDHRARRWQEPLSAYRGIRHKVHTTSAGAVHTLVLEHPQPSRSLHIAYETHIANQAIVEAAQRYNLPVLPSAAIGGSHWLTGGWLKQLRGFDGAPNAGRHAAST